MLKSLRQSILMEKVTLFITKIKFIENMITKRTNKFVVHPSIYYEKLIHICFTDQWTRKLSRQTQKPTALGWKVRCGKYSRVKKLRDKIDDQGQTTAVGIVR